MPNLGTMKTEYARQACLAFNPHALRQILDWAVTVDENLTQYAHEAATQEHDLAKAKEYISDSYTFAKLRSALNDILDNIPA